jgi:hypothetical protein
MCRAVTPYIISSSKLHIQQQAYVKQLLLPAASGTEMEIHEFQLAHPSSR